MKRLRIILLAIAALVATAASAENIVDRAARKANSAAGLTARFAIDGHRSQLTVSGVRYAIDTPSMKVYYDGTTQWTYLPEDAEVTLTRPTADEQAQVNPLAVLTTLRHNFKVALQGSNKATFTPKNPSQSEISRIVVTFDTATAWPTAVSLTSGGHTVNISGISITTSSTVPATGSFRFTAPKGVTTIDLR
jgi:outer membrane lipoprotein-sorting protein